MTDETRLDHELAAFTDDLLAGEETQAAPEIEALAQTVRQLHQLVNPDTGPSPAFRERLAQQLNEEWAKIQQPPSTSASWQDRLAARRSSGSISSQLGRSRLARLMAVAAVVTVALAVAYLIEYSSGGSGGQSGTATGDLPWSVLVGIIVVALLGLLVFWLGRRSKL